MTFNIGDLVRVKSKEECLILGDNPPNMGQCGSPDSFGFRFGEVIPISNNGPGDSYLLGDLLYPGKWLEYADVRESISVNPDLIGPSYDPVNHPTHYAETVPGVECIEVTKHFSFCRGNAIKYLWRAGHKDASKTIEDLQKAIWYIEKEIETLGGGK